MKKRIEKYFNFRINRINWLLRWTLLWGLTIIGYFSFSETKEPQRITPDLNEISLPSALVQNAIFLLPQGVLLSEIEAVRYGNDLIGFFDSENYSIEKKQIKIDLLPPTYRKQILFFIVFKNKSRSPQKLGEKSYSNAILESIQPRIERSGHFSFPFFFMSVDVRKDADSVRTVPAIFNSLGEVVWIFSTPSQHKEKSLWGYEFNVMEPGRFALLSRRSETTLIRTDGFGKQVLVSPFKGRLRPNSQTFDYNENAKSLFYLSPDCRDLYYDSEFIPMMSGPIGFFRKLILPRRTYLGSRLVHLNIMDGKSKVLWNTFDDFSPADNRRSDTGQYLYFDPFVFTQTMDQYRSILTQKSPANWANWPDQICDVDWSHESSIRYFPEQGFLVSIRNLNKVALISPSGKLAWTLGNDPTDTYYFSDPKTKIFMQNSATFLNPNKILIYDNHDSLSSAEFRYTSNRLVIADLANPGKIDSPKVIELPFPKSIFRGSSDKIPNGNLFVYTAGDRGIRSQILEINPTTLKTAGELNIRLFTPFKTIAAKPVYSLSGEKWISFP